MDWAGGNKYRRYEDASDAELDLLNFKVNSSPWRQTYHVQPVTGLLNDPNGFSFFNEEYHLFYQWHPLGPVHGLKYWYHTKSKDLVHWQNVGVALRPDCYFDSHGAYSGSAIEHNGCLYLIYTGNTRDDNSVRHPFQCLAIMDPSGTLSKWKNPIIASVPSGYTEHFRDPKVWKENGQFYIIIGAQRSNETGSVVLYSSTNLSDWDFQGEIETQLNEFGYMWECPDYFVMDEQGVLIFSPQGIEPLGEQFRNIYQSGYIIGSTINMEKKSFQHSDFIELDRGFDFYAPQTMQHPNGRRILVGWMGLPDIKYPTDLHGWAHCLTIPRELSINHGKVIQQPIKELEELRFNEKQASDTLINETKEYDGFSGIAYELICEFSYGTAKEFGIEFRAAQDERTVIKYSPLDQKVIFDRKYSGEAVALEYGTERVCALRADKIKFHMFVDSSSVEIFVNNGEEVFTSRIFPNLNSTHIRFFANQGDATFKAIKWDFKKMETSN
ncbi:sucrose-6-phosphate hydrolase [Paenibacillus illinoisensis]|uniref:glycoside hydrolase family 32 protein n=1 Tax=Paenibacillus illinoisensis TaxID=59845 RepID=UPI003D2B4313